METKEKKKISLSLGIVFALSGIFLGAGVGALTTFLANRLPSDEQKLLDEYRILKNDWLYGNENEFLADDTAAAILSNTNDPYTFYTKSYDEQNLGVDGKGFGISTRYIGGAIYVKEVHNGPSKNLLKEGDIIIGCTRNSSSYDSFSLLTSSQIQEYLADSNYSTYVFKVRRDGLETDVTVIKGEYSKNLVTLVSSPKEENNYQMCVKVSSFLGNPTIHLKALIDNELKNSKINKLVIDLRENGGGYVEQARNMAKLFVKKDQYIYSLVNKNNKEIEKEYQTSDPTFNIPSYSLILDQNSASASELFALAMIAGTSCKTYGLKSYGKGIAQQFTHFSDGSVIRYTYAYVYGPNKDNTDKICIHNKGITPDKVFSTDYTYLLGYTNLESLLGVSASTQQSFLKTLHLLDSDLYPSSYSDTFHFTDLVSLYASNNGIRGFNSDGTISKELSDKYAYDTNSLYTKYYNDLTSEVINDR